MSAWELADSVLPFWSGDLEAGIGATRSLYPAMGLIAQFLMAISRGL